MKIKLEIPTDVLRAALIGDGYLAEEVEYMTEDKLRKIWTDRIETEIQGSYYKGMRIGLY